MLNAGIIDSDYTDEIKLVLANISNKTFILHEYERVGQMIFKEYKVFERIMEVNELPSIENNNRIGGFGSTN
jgi:dUTPase